MRPIHGNDGSMSSDIVEPIAIIGLATRFPQQATTTEKLWETLLQARSTWSPIPEERFNAAAFYHPDPEHGGTFHVQGGHFLAEDPAFFDSAFFNIARNELLTLDPQQRLVLESSYHALENAGIPMGDTIASRTSVFVSGFNHDYLGILNSDPETTAKYKPTGVTNAILSNRVSWFFDFKGPSMTIDTACSSSLVALHLAVQSLRCRESDMALVSGVSILENPVETIGMSHHGLLGAQGRSFSFESRAEGYARGEGVGTVILKPLSMAVRDGDTIRAVIRETGVNQDGRTPGITVPSADAQERLIREVYWRAGLSIEQTRFVEAHGTGTSTGDPVEAGALARAFKCGRNTPLYVGTIKSTIGHLEGGSGVASIIKAILILESGIIPPNHDIQQTNPKIPTRDWNIEFPKCKTPWPSDGLRRVSVNSFGIGGTNAHCVLDDAFHYLHDHHISGIHNTTPVVPIADQMKALDSGKFSTEKALTLNTFHPPEESDNSACEVTFIDTPTSDDLSASPTFGSFDVYGVFPRAPRLYMLTALDEGGVKRNASAYADFLTQSSHPGLCDNLLDDLSFTLSTKRSIFPWKSFVMASTTKELAWNLMENNYTKPVRTTSPPEIAFVFTGQGAQYQAMGRALMTYPVFQKSMEEASDFIRRLGSPWDLIGCTYLLADEYLAETKRTRVNLPEIAHPLCTALQVAIVDLLASWDIFPGRVIGHSSGEIAAAYCTGKLSREGAWKAAYYRGYVSSKQTSSNGAMMAVGLDKVQIEGYMGTVRESSHGELIIACYNSPSNNTVSGDEDLVNRLKKTLDSDSVFTRKLDVKNAYHSSHMHPIADDYRRLMGNLFLGRRLATPHGVQMFSTVTGEEIHTEHLPAQYWVDNMVSPVRFTGGLSAMQSSVKATTPDCLSYIVEIGPHSTLQSAIKQSLGISNGQPEAKYLPILKRNDPTLNVLLSTVGFLAVGGCQLDLHKINLASRAPPQRPPRLLVNLPLYSFKHTEKVLYESRLNKNLRGRKFPRHDLFGAPVVDWNSNIPRWRHFIRLNENPWLRDHMVTGNYVYPGVGYLVMAIEASRQLSREGAATGFQLRNVSLKRALVIPDTKEGIEISLALTAVDEASEARLWRRFQISSHNDTTNEWIEHCVGFIATEFKPESRSFALDRESVAQAELWKTQVQDVANVCKSPIDFSRVYDNLQNGGLGFGPLFRNLDSVRMSGSKLGLITGIITVPDIAESMPKQYMHSHLIHPATMDSMIHMMIAAVLDITGSDSLDKIRLPTFIHDMWISAELNSAPSQRFSGHASVSVAASEKLEGQILISDPSTQSCCIRMDGIELTPLESGPVEFSDRRLCTKIAWKPDVHFLDTTTARQLSSTSDRNHEDGIYWVKRLQLATMLYVTDALADLNDLDSPKLDLHQQRFYDWMRYQQERLCGNAITHLSCEEFHAVNQNAPLKHSILQEIATHSAEGAITVRMGSNIVSMMQKKISPLDLMFGQDGVMEEVYKEGLHLYNLPDHLHNHLSLLQYQHAQLNILEIGGGTGSFTAEVLKVLAPQHDTANWSIANYTFTDVSSGFFEKAQQRFMPWRNIMNFQSLDIARDPRDQGFKTGTYDLIFAGNVIHATANLRTTLQNLRFLLRQGGQLIMQEGIRQDFLWYPLVFGQLPGWWLGHEPIRKWCPYIPASEWHGILSDSGFSGVDIEYPSSNDEDLTWQSIMVSTAIADSKPVLEIVILCSSIQERRSVFIRDHLQKKGAYISLVLPHEVAEINWQERVCISTIDLEDPILAGMDKVTFSNIQRLLMECQHVLWLLPTVDNDPFSNMSLGLLRTVRWERDADASNIVTLETPNLQNVDEETLAATIHKIVWYQFVDNVDVDRHAEYSLKENVVHIGRLCEWDEPNNYLSLQSSNFQCEPQRLGDLSHPIELISSLGDPRWATDLQHTNPLGENEIEISVRAVGLDTDPHAVIVVAEGAGTILNVGSAVKSLHVGDNVVFVSQNDRKSCLRTMVRVSEEVAVKLPENISFESAAALPLIYAAAIYGLEDVACLAEKDTVLVHAGTSACGQAAIQCAKMAHAEIYATVSTANDVEFLATEYGIPESHIFSSEDLSFVKGVMRCTKGKGVNVIFNTLTGEMLQESLTCIAPFGCFLDLSRKGRFTTPIDFAALGRNVTITNIDIAAMSQRRPRLLRRLISEALKLHVEGRVGPPHPLDILDFSQTRDASEYIRSKDGASKIVFSYDPSTTVPVIPDPRSSYQFEEAASYVLAGGLGGLGRSLARWMASRGARSLIFLSRSGRVTEAVKEMIRDLKTFDCNAHIFKCDVSDASNLQAVIAECSISMPPIKGCIQGSMVLQDGTFAGMSYDDWQVAVEPKVQGSWNLHEALPTNLDFFVMLSSVAGIFGNRGQANYAAGNTFQDGLAAFRAAKGMNASSINLGSVSKVGWVADNRSSMRTHTATLFELLRENEVHTAVEYMIDPRNKKKLTDGASSQLVLGLPTAEICRQNGIPPPTYLNYSLFTHLRTAAVPTSTEKSEAEAISTADLLTAASNLDEAVKIVSAGISKKLSSLLAIPVSDINPRQFSFGGIDSLVAMEFLSWIVKDLKAEVSLLDIMSAQNVQALSEKVSQRSKLSVRASSK
ncbi:Acyl transferase/acyl hydrolase/lysophospholipase [Penicillium capsulatum]|nr:Acyl transferase/acyl hydrolase/lysophospholipase [Penicillium capsulatum]